MSTVHEAFFARSAAHPDKPALILAGESGSTSYGALATRVDRLVDALGARELHGGRPVLLVAQDGPAVIALALACSTLGIALAPVDPELGPRALKTACERLGVGLVVHDAAGAERVPFDVPCVELADLERASVRPAEGASARADAPLLLTLSSGSTGDPKPVTFTTGGKLARALHTAAEFDVTGDDVVLNASPFHHSLGQRLTIMPLVLGATLVLLRPFSPGAWLDAVARHGVTFSIPVSSHLAALQSALVNPATPLGRLRALVSSSAGIDPNVKRALASQPRFDFHEMYGASEVATATRLGPEDARRAPGSVGRACAGVRLRIVDAESRALGVDEVGEIQVRSPLASPGYFGRPELDERAFVDGWFRTGDLGRLDPHGYLYFVDRTSDVVVSGGANIFPSDVERFARDLAGVADCVAFGVPDAYLGEALVAVVQTERHDAGGAPERRVLDRELRAAARAQLAPAQRPLAWFFTDALPLGSTGKIDRRALRAEYASKGLDLSAAVRSAQARRAA